MSIRGVLDVTAIRWTGQHRLRSWISAIVIAKSPELRAECVLTMSTFKTVSRGRPSSSRDQTAQASSVAEVSGPRSLETDPGGVGRAFHGGLLTGGIPGVACALTVRAASGNPSRARVASVSHTCAAKQPLS